MACKLPEPLRALVEQIGKLPGLGPKSAMRVALTLLKWPETETRRLGQAISSLRDNICLCERCGGLASSSPCSICSDAQRDHSVLCIVPEWDSLLAMEEGLFYDGQYLILGGLLEPMQKRDSSTLELERLQARLAEGEIAEVVLALGSTVEAENTASFLRKIIRGHYPEIKITRLAQGLPMGAEVKFMDRETLRQSMKNRQSL